MCCGCGGELRASCVMPSKWCVVSYFFQIMITDVPQLPLGGRSHVSAYPCRVFQLRLRLVSQYSTVVVVHTVQWHHHDDDGKRGHRSYGCLFGDC
jgi:hypothetical protein